MCEIVHGGYLTNRKSINVPNLSLNLPGVTQKDIEDIKYGIKVGFDYIAASFVRKPQDILDIRKVLKDNNGEHIKIIAKTVSILIYLLSQEIFFVTCSKIIFSS